MQLTRFIAFETMNFFYFLVEIRAEFRMFLILGFLEKVFTISRRKALVGEQE